eukprot:GEMP01087450.1.p1 GENE.GEMP01087450.1~~GEMP01087450.1.p1  ORF type:complete len:127 (+),score=28.30 GEMP01087450.1:45-425(+)
MPTDFVSIHPYFTVIDQAKAKTVLAKFVEVTKKEPGCIYYSFLWSENGTKLFGREAYVDGDAAVAHVAGVGPLFPELLADDVAKIDRLEIQGPADEIVKLKESVKDFNPAYFESGVPEGFVKGFKA